MSNYVLIAIVTMGVVYGAVFYLTAQKRKKLKERFENLDMRIEAGNAAIYSRELLDNHFTFVAKQIDAPIDAFTIANLEYTAANQVKDIAKDTLKTFATLGTVKFNTVQTPKYLVLSGDDLHLLDTDTDGDICKHLIFDKNRLGHSAIEEVPLSKMQTAQAKYSGNNPRCYKFSLETEGKNVNIILYNTLMNTFADGAGSLFSNNTDRQVKNFVVGNYFLKKLGEKIPSLKTATAF